MGNDNMLSIGALADESKIMIFKGVSTAVQFKAELTLHFSDRGPSGDDAGTFVYIEEGEGAGEKKEGTFETHYAAPDMLILRSGDEKKLFAPFDVEAKTFDTTWGTC